MSTIKDLKGITHNLFNSSINGMILDESDATPSCFKPPAFESTYILFATSSSFMRSPTFVIMRLLKELPLSVLANFYTK